MRKNDGGLILSAGFPEPQESAEAVRVLRGGNEGAKMRKSAERGEKP